MATDVIMPKVDMDQETGTVAQWLKEEGDEVKQGETILEIETDKVAIEVEAPATGILSGILVDEGETVPIATVIAYILEPGEALPDQAKPAETKAEAPKSSLETTVRQTDWEVPATPVARNMAEASGIDLAGVSGTGPRGRVTKKDVQDALAVPKPFDNGEGKVYATPAARRISNEMGVQLGNLSGSGPDGRIQAADVLAAAERGVVTAETIEPLTPAAEVEVIPLRGMRRTIADRLTASYQQTPHIGFTWRNDMTRFNETRAQLNAHADKTGSPRISATALIVKIVGSALARHPWLNSSFQGEEIHLHRDINIGVAVALDTGLIVPVVHDVAAKSVSELAAAVKDLSTRAREGQLIPSEVRGGTFTISNLGPFGVEEFNAIINPPEAAILAIGATQNEVVADNEGQVVVRPMMHMTLSADHRVVDGAVAAHFIADLKAALEQPVLLLM
ncbi:MAG: dihydrolipoamide acetyltransferase family protein [Candidatus Promineifilaceae bacterium]|nr:dihydrolipoamide acetyltransferase family protein [Candidatus Promineifilaceae bacterium]